MITLDGVIQGPGAPDEDTSGGFEYGGWVAPYTDDVYDKVVAEELKPAEYLLGRKTFEIWEEYWPTRDFWPGINEGMKYVLSKTSTATEWKNATFIHNEDDIKKLRDLTGPDLHVWGSSELVHLLMQHDLVDELRLKIHPLVLGKGKKLFDGHSVPAAFTLRDSTVTTTGVILANYMRSGNVKTGSVDEYYMS